MTRQTKIALIEAIAVRISQEKLKDDERTAAELRLFQLKLMEECLWLIS